MGAALGISLLRDDVCLKASVPGAPGRQALILRVGRAFKLAHYQLCDCKHLLGKASSLLDKTLPAFRQ
jgi:hypothetical protein